MKRIFKDRIYRVEKYTAESYVDYGTMAGEDVHAVIKGCKYDEELGMFFSKNGKIGYSVEDAN